MPRRVLFITYYFPPSGGPGVQRPLKTVRYLPEAGWEPTVLTLRPEAAAYPDLDASLLADIPEDIPVLRTPAWDPYTLYARILGQDRQASIGVGFGGESDPNLKQRLGRWLRANFFLPDARVGWVPYATWEARALLAQQRFDAILTTGPPHSTHLIGRSLARRVKLPWVAEFRDPWVGHDFYHELPMSALAKRVDAHYEASVLQEADAVVGVSPALVRRLQDRGAAYAQLIWNGFDPADFESAAPAVSRERFVIGYAGNMNASRNPEALWQALAQLREADAIPKLAVEFVGNVDPVVQASAERHGVADLLTVQPYLPHADAVAFMRRCALLLLVINRVPGNEGIVTGKVFEYLGTQRPILGLGPPHGDAAPLLADPEAGQMFGYEAVAEVAAMVRRQYEAWDQGSPLAGAAADALEPYSRRGQAHALADLLTHLAT